MSWIEDRCEIDANKFATAGELFASWKDWTERNNEFTGSIKAFGMKLVEHGFEKSHSMTGATYRGIGLA